MSLRSWIRARLSTRTRGPRRGRSPAPRLEALEDRCLPAVVSTAPAAAAIAATVAGGQHLPAGNDNVVIDWNATALQAVWTDGTQPTVASRALAMVQVAVYDAVDAINPQYALYPVPGLHAKPAAGASADAAAAAAADEVLTSLYPKQKALFDAQLQASLANVPDGSAKTSGVAFGRAVADAVLAWRSTDGSSAPSNYKPGEHAGRLHRVEVAQQRLLLGDLVPVAGRRHGLAGHVGPEGGDLGLHGGAEGAGSSAQGLGDVEVGGVVEAVQGRRPGREELGGALHRERGDAAPLRRDRRREVRRRQLVLARVGARGGLLDMGLADAAITCWDAKYVYNTWRPVTAIQDAGSDGNPLTAADPTWMSLWKSPAFPEYTSGHSTFSGAAAAILSSLFGSHVSFTIGSDALPGTTGTFSSFNQAADEAGFSRILGGIHFVTANVNGLQSGRQLGRYVVQNYLAPLHGGRDAAAAAPGLASASWRLGGDQAAGETPWKAAQQAENLAKAIVADSGATMKAAARARLTARIAAKLRPIISQLGSLDFS
jgi:hypothetical protein